MFAFFLLVQYGPHTLINQGSISSIELRIGDAMTSSQIGMALGFLSVSGGLFLAFVALPAKRSQFYTQTSRPPSSPRLQFWLAATVCLAYMMTFLALDGPGLPRLHAHVDFFLGQSANTYTDIRRVLFVESPYERVAALTQFTLTPLLFALVLALELRRGSARSSGCRCACSCLASVPLS